MGKMNNDCRINLGLILILLIGLFSSCEEKILPDDKLGSILGTVVSSEGDSLDGVIITTSPATSSLITDEDGQFELLDIAVGEYNITAKKSMYKTQSVSVVVEENETNSVVIAMEENITGDLEIELSPTPADGTNGISINPDLSWNVTGDLTSDELRFDVYLYSSSLSDKELIANNVNDTIVSIKNLDYEVTYFWQVIAFQDGDEIESSDVWSFRTLDFPENEILFARRVNGSFEIFSGSSDTLNPTVVQLTDEQTSFELSPKMSPINDLVAFSSNRDIDPHIYTMKQKGTDVRKVTSLPVIGNHNNGEGYCWSPDASKILYSHFDKLYTINRDGTGLNNIAKAPDGRHFRHCDWTFQGKIVVQTIGVRIYDSELYLMDEDGTNMELIVDNLPGRIENPSFSIAGDKVLFTKDDAGFDSADGRQLNSNIYLLDLNSLQLTNISVEKTPGTNDLEPRFSSDGAKIIFVNTSNTGNKQKNIMVMDLDGDNRVIFYEDAQMPFWF